MNLPKHVAEVCRPGEGKLTCRYLTVSGMPPAGFVCGKLDAKVKHTIDSRVRDGKFNAQGDNCEGVTTEELRKG